MSAFLYIARDDSGQIQRGQQQALSRAELQTSLSNRGLRLVSVRELVQKQSPLAVLGRYLNPWQWLPPRSIDIELLLSQLAVMLRSGLTLLTALKTAGEQARYIPMKRLIEKLSDEIQDGKPLADAMQSHACIPPIAIQMTRVGELTGTLDAVLDQASKQLASRRRTVSNTLTALAYPAFVFVAAIAVSAYMVIFVIPEIEKALLSLGRPLPRMTQSLVDLSAWIHVNGPSVLVIMLAVIMATVFLFMWPKSRMVIDRTSLRVPLIGNVLRLGGTVTFSTSMRAMVTSGITVSEALRTAEQLHGNRFLASRVASAREAVMAGDGLAETLSEEHTFAPMLGSMVSVAENTGQMEEVLEQVAEFHDEQLQAAIRRLSALVEPLVVLVVGGIVGYVYISFFLALFASGGIK